MTVETDQDLAIFFDGDDFAELAMYRPVGGGPDLPVTIIAYSAERVSEIAALGMRGSFESVLIRAAEVADPRDGDLVIRAGGASYRVRVRRSEGADRRIWRLDLQEA